MKVGERPKEGLRERKRRETLRRIAETGLKLFLANGYEATTLDAIAAAAGISRRTFFYYFKSKEEILLASQGASADLLGAALREGSREQRPIDAVLGAMVKVAAQHETGEAIAIDRLLRSNEALRTRKQASYIEQELALFETLCELWPQPERRSALRYVAMVSIGAMRLALEAWSQAGGGRPIEEFLRAAFATLNAEM